jgi:hypothetical protein
VLQRSLGFLAPALNLALNRNLSYLNERLDVLKKLWERHLTAHCIPEKRAIRGRMPLPPKTNKQSLMNK